MFMQALNPAAIDQNGFKGAGLYTFNHPAVPFGSRTMWATRAADGAIEITEGDGEPVVARLSDDEFRDVRDWPVRIGPHHFIIGTACVDMGGFQ